ncbi:G-type lectin S-receptor-like serine/threonine-protein kinase [Nymphaea thermarum]|nr:G-type lectin S-receptor-like serine/threonine-protein kinase [Nymphaea thermarum]
MVGKNATLRFEVSGNLRLTDGDGATVWETKTSNSGAIFGKLSDWGNLVLYFKWDVTPWPWESFGHPTVALQFSQNLTEKAELTTIPNALGNYHSLAFVRSGCTVRLALTYVQAKASNFTYWRGPALESCRGGSASTFLTTGGSFVMTCGGAAGTVTYIFRSPMDFETPGQKFGETLQLKLEDDGRLVLSRFDVSSRLWVREWATGSTPCAAPGVCGNGICSLHAGQKKGQCSCPPGYSLAADGDCRRNVTAEAGCRGGEGYVMAKIEKTNYFVGGSTIAKHTNVTRGKDCGELCKADCRCVASLYSPAWKESRCWTLRALEFGGFPDPSVDLYVKVAEQSHPSRPLKTDSGHSEELVENDLINWLVPLTLPLSLLLYVLVNQKRRRIEGKDEGGEGSLTTVPGMPVSFSFAELHEATSGFSQQIARGGFSYIYKGKLQDGSEVAVKQLDERLSHGQRNFEAEVFTIGAMNHTNLITIYVVNTYMAAVHLLSPARLSAYRILVYEFMENGSLDQWLFAREDGKAKRLRWKTRFDIAMSTAKGIAYCHEQCRNFIIHCDIKPGNVLLDGSFRAKVSDFGLAKLVAGGENPTISVRGTRGYLAPEWLKHRPITVKVDVYSFGMLLLDLVGGRRTKNLASDRDDFYYPVWAYEQLKNGTPEATADPTLEGDVDADELMRCLRVAFWCLQENASTRPTMGKVVKMLEGVVPIDTPDVPRSFLYLMMADGEFSTNSHGLIHTTPATTSSCMSPVEGR